MITATTAWPEGVIARYLTVAGATDDSRRGHIVAICTGERCRAMSKPSVDA